MSDEDLETVEKAAERARIAILEMGETPQVKKFLWACAMNTLEMKRKGEAEGMDFEIHGQSFTFRAI